MSEEQAEPRRVLVAEDEGLIRLDIVETLTQAGFEVVGEAADGEEAVELALELEPRSEERRVGKECRSRWSPYH